jgi:tRNA(adenine34) deaminase
LSSQRAEDFSSVADLPPAAERGKCYPLFRVEPDLQFMQKARKKARAAAAPGEVPIGAVLVHNNEIIAWANNRIIRDCDPTAHAEIVALRAAARHFANYRMPGTTLYVTLEPCIMCAGAMIQARIERVVYAADDPKGGAARTCFTALSNPALNHQVPFTAGILAAESAALLQSFFAARR